MRYKARVRVIVTSRWVLFRAFLRGRYEESWHAQPPFEAGEWEKS